MSCHRIASRYERVCDPPSLKRMVVGKKKPFLTRFCLSHADYIDKGITKDSESDKYKRQVQKETAMQEFNLAEIAVIAAIIVFQAFWFLANRGSFKINRK